ncbi:hypothetical protein [Amycolatopsis circi]|uniref:hypothetical protein n=1 Tax=Amycolatopsis circi TaxID=871959 RepID=UPI000E22B104|nr:hypothetical protein [Amycolatopsis circi]
MSRNKPGGVVLVGLDESAASLAAVRWAAAEARCHGGTFSAAVKVWTEEGRCAHSPATGWW